MADEGRSWQSIFTHADNRAMALKCARWSAYAALVARLAAQAGFPVF